MTIEEIAKEIVVKTFIDEKGTFKDYDLWLERKLKPSAYIHIDPELYETVDSSMCDLYNIVTKVLLKLELQETKDLT